MINMKESRIQESDGVKDTEKTLILERSRLETVRQIEGKEGFRPKLEGVARYNSANVDEIFLLLSESEVGLLADRFNPSFQLALKPPCEDEYMFSKSVVNG